MDLQRIALAVPAGHDGDDFLLHGVLDDVRKSADHRPAQATVNHGVKPRSRCHPPQRVVDRVSKIAAQPGTLLLVPLPRFEQVALG